MSREILFLLPDPANSTDTPPHLTWWHVYGAIDGYGMLFDPLVEAVTRVVPEWAYDVSAGAADAFLIASCAACSEQVAGLNRPGVYVRPPEGRFLLERGRTSEKETLATPTGEIFYPTGYPWALLYDRYAGPDGTWMLGEFPAVVRTDHAVAVGVDLFNMLFHLNADWPEKRLLLGAQWLRDLLVRTGAFDGVDSASGANDDMRIDFQAYGVNRLQIQRLLTLRGASRDLVADADSHYLEACTAWLGGRDEHARAGLGAAFSALADLRRQHSKLEAYLCEIPHIGLLLADKGFFELEWPAHSRRTLLSYINQIEKHGYRVSVEGGAGCWRNLVKRFPRLGDAIRKQWHAGTMDLTNGTYSLPFALLSPLALQYWQFRVGRETFRETFGAAPHYYQAQENSLSPQMPELLRHFGYTAALHISQNRGTAPGEPGSFIRWQSPAGHEIPAIAVWDRPLGRKGVHFYLDLPVVFDTYHDRTDPMVYVNFQDLGYVFLRVQMIRAHQYAPVWGQYATAAQCFDHHYKADHAPTRCYSADDYQISDNVFYWDLTNANELSQLERVHRGAGLLRQTQMAAYAAGQYETVREQIEQALPGLCLQEAHDAILVQAGRVGEFRGKAATMAVPPYSRSTLADEVLCLNQAMVHQLVEVQRQTAPGAATMLFNASGADLPFARVSDPDRYQGTGLVRCEPDAYAVGPFPAFGAAPAAQTSTQWERVPLPLGCGRWRIDLDDAGRVCLAFDGQVVRAIPVDSRLGQFRVEQAQARTCDQLISVRLTYTLTTEAVQTVLVHVLCHRDSPLADVTVRYASARAFDRKDRWGDCLALELACEAPLATVWRFNPNVRAETAENRIASPSYLAVQTESEEQVCFLNEGACVYTTDRPQGRVRWLFHVADETQTHRRMAVVFGRSEALAIERGWSMGVLPSGVPTRSLPALREGWDSTSAETFVDGHRLLISNLLAQTRSLTFEDAAGLDLCDAVGASLVTGRHGDVMTCRMGPFELGFLTGLGSVDNACT